MRRAKAFTAALHTRNKLLRRDGDICHFAFFANTVITDTAIFTLKGLAEIGEQWLAPACAPLGVARHRIQMLVRRGSLRFLFLVYKIPELAGIGIVIKQQTMCRQTIASGAPDLLVITFNTLWQIKMDHEAHVRLINAHNKCNRRHDNLCVIPDESFLVALALI